MTAAPACCRCESADGELISAPGDPRHVWISDCIDALRTRLSAAEKTQARLLQDRYDALTVHTKEGLLASEWVLRTGKAVRERDEALTRLSAAEAKLAVAEYALEKITDCQVCISCVARASAALEQIRGSGGGDLSGFPVQDGLSRLDAAAAPLSTSEAAGRYASPSEGTPGSGNAPGPAASVSSSPAAEGGACPRCEGCGQIANDEDGSPWTIWQALPPGSDVAVRMGIVWPIPCPDCTGRSEGGTA